MTVPYNFGFSANSNLILTDSSLSKLEDSVTFIDASGITWTCFARNIGGSQQLSLLQISGTDGIIDDASLIQSRNTINIGLPNGCITLDHFVANNGVHWIVAGRNNGGSLYLAQISGTAGVVDDQGTINAYAQIAKDVSIGNNVSKVKAFQDSSGIRWLFAGGRNSGVVALLQISGTAGVVDDQATIDTYPLITRDIGVSSIYSGDHFVASNGIHWISLATFTGHVVTLLQISGADGIIDDQVTIDTYPLITKAILTTTDISAFQDASGTYYIVTCSFANSNAISIFPISGTDGIVDDQVTIDTYAVLTINTGQTASINSIQSDRGFVYLNYAGRSSGIMAIQRVSDASGVMPTSQAQLDTVAGVQQAVTILDEGVVREADTRQFQTAESKRLAVTTTAGTYYLHDISFVDDPRTINNILSEPISSITESLLVANNSAQVPGTLNYFSLDIGISTNEYSFDFLYTRDEADSGTLGSGSTIDFINITSDITNSSGITVASGATIRLGKKAGPFAIDFTFQSGSTLEVYPDSDRGGAPLDLSNHTFNSGTTINVTSGTANVTVGSGQSGNITAGAGVAVSGPQVSLAIPNAEDGVRVQISRLDTISFNATDISTTTNQITLTGNNFSAASFPTLVRIAFEGDATIPTSTPQIVDGGLYFVTAVSADLVTLSTTEGGTTISFSDQGVDGAARLAIASGFTELDDSIVAGGSGYSASFSLPNGTPILVKAAHWSSSGGIASASEFFQTTVAWSTAAGATIVDAIGISSMSDTIHNQIASLSSIALSSEVIDANGNAVSSINPVSDGSTVTGVNIILEGVGRVQVNANDSDGILAVVDLYMFAAYFRATEAGIRIVFGGSDASVIATDIFNIITNNIQFDNTNMTVPLSLVGAILRDGKGRSLVAPGSNSIAFNVATTGTGAVVETGTSGLTSGESNILSNLDTRTTRVDALIEDSSGDRFTAKALEAGPSGGGSGGDASAANQTTIINALADIPTTTEFVARTLPAADYFDAASDIVARVTLVDTTTTNTDMRGTDGANTVVPDNAGIAAIPTNPLLTTDTRLNNLDAAVSSRSSFDPSSDTVARVTLVDTTTVNTDMRGTDAANTVTPDNASIAAILIDTGTDIPNAIASIPTNPLLTTDTRLNNLDAAISSRSSHPEPDLSNLDVAVSSRSTFNPISDSVIAANMRGTDGALTDLPAAIPATWVTDIQSGLGTEAKQDTIIANIAALTSSDATLANQTAILTIVERVQGKLGFDPARPMVSTDNEGTGDRIEWNGEVTEVNTVGNIRTYASL
ncbi:MAG: hypothetical protein AAGD25_06965 [Cyanobacteria bacterium P01_F01_bin.150]